MRENEKLNLDNRMFNILIQVFIKTLLGYKGRPFSANKNSVCMNTKRNLSLLYIFKKGNEVCHCLVPDMCNQ